MTTTTEPYGSLLLRASSGELVDADALLTAGIASGRTAAEVVEHLTSANAAFAAWRRIIFEAVGK